MEDVTVHMLLQILTPFIIYLISEEIGVSGILAVVAGGIIHAIKRPCCISAVLSLVSLGQHLVSSVIHPEWNGVSCSRYKHS